MTGLLDRFLELSREVLDGYIADQQEENLHLDFMTVSNAHLRSAIHRDLVFMQTPEWGGGEVWFDGVLVRKDGLFVLPELEGLNPENLM